MTVRAGREFLAIPGPTTMPDEVLAAMHRPAIDIYAGPLLDITEAILIGLARLFHSARRPYIYIANGHGAWEAALTNTLSKGDKVLVLESGRFAGVLASNDLSLGEGARKMTAGDWKEALQGRGAQDRPLMNPGELRNGLLFGDLNFNGAVNVFDVIDVQNVAAASLAPAVQLLVNTDVTDRDMVLSANVAPANLPGYGDPTDAVPPGVAAGGSSTNIDSRIVNVFDAIDIQNGAAILCNTADPTFNNFVSCHPIPGRDAAAFSTDSVIVSCPIVGNRTFDRDSVYILPTLAGNAPCFVGGNGDSTVVSQAPATASAVLTIEAGTRIVGDTNAALLIARNGQIFANGTLAQPIVMRCRRLTCAPGAWGGLVINGNAQINNGIGTAAPAITGRSVGGGNQATAEGFGGNYGGPNNADNSGVLRFVIIEASGSRFSGTNERNGLTLNAVGNGTTIDYVQSVGGLDDGVEWFGGTVNVRHAYVDNTQDDGLDWVGGARFNLQFGIVRGCNSGCDNGIEADNLGSDGGTADPEAAPRSAPVLSNVTLVGSATPATPTTGFHGMLLRQNTAGRIRNFLALDYKAAIDIDSTGALAGTPPNSPGIIMSLVCNDSLSVRNGILGGSAGLTTAQGGGAFSNGDADAADPRFATRAPTTPSFGCAAVAPHPLPAAATSYFHDGGGTNLFNLEQVYILEPLNNLVDDLTRSAGAAANYYLVAPYATIPDFRPRAARAADVGLRSGSTGCAIDATTLGSFFRAASYCGAVDPVGAVANIPWYAGWTNPR